MSTYVLRYETDWKSHPYPGICRATLAMAYDNGAIHRGHREADVLRDMAEPLLSYTETQLRAISNWLLTLDPDSFDIVCCGEQDDADTLTEAAPFGTSALLDAIFDAI